jgi:TolB protein
MKKIFLFILIILIFKIVTYAQSDIYLSISTEKKFFDIGVDYFTVPDRNDNTMLKYAQLFKKIIENDLIFSRYFNVLRNIPGNYDLDLRKRLSSWEKQGATVVFTGSLTREDGSSNIVLEIKMLDVITADVIWTNKYKSGYLNYRIVAHEVSNEIVRRFTGEPGIASSKIVFANNSTRFKELYIVDYDGYNLRKLTKDNKINILPKWAPNGEQIIYTSYLYNNPDLFVLDINKNKRDIISKHQGLNVAGSFSPDGKKILLTLSRGKYPNLYLIKISGEILKKITDGSHIDTSPSFAPNGQEIVFVSDRSGYPQLYIMNIDGCNVRRLTTNGFCDSPSWSPRGDKIVFTMRQKGSYDLYVYDLPTARLIKLTNNKGNNENPTWSPDGRFVAFYSNRSGKGEIYIMAVDGSGLRKLVEMPGSSYTPSWSPPILNK